MHTAAKFRRQIAITTATALSVCIGSAAHSQEPVQTDELEQITVTAQRRAESVQAVPIAITVLTEQSTANAGVLKIDQLSLAVPTLELTHNANGVVQYIRGVGTQDASTGEENAVGLYLDDLYLFTSNAAAFQLSSISSIEVLNGPQGTLFGRNATGGVIHVRTRNPTAEPALDASITYGNYDTVSGNLYATGALARNLSANISIYGTNQADGWGHDVVTGEKAFTERDYGFRSKLLWTPAENTTILLSGGHSRVQGEVGLGFNQIPGSTGAGGTGFVGWYNTADLKNDSAANSHDDVALRVDQGLGWAQLVSISGWQQMSGFSNFNQDASPAGLVMYTGEQFGRDLSQEIQLLSPDDSAVKWIGGFFFMHDTSGYDHSRLGGAAVVAPLAGFPVTNIDPYIDIVSQVSTTSFAGFAQATYEIFPKTNLTLGARLTSDKREFSGDWHLSAALGGGAISGVPCGTTLCPYRDQKTYGQPSYRAVIDHHFNDDVMTYVSFDRGFKSGEYDSFGSASPSGPISVRPEILKAYEVGIKSQFFNRRLELNSSAFYYDYSNIQFTSIVAGGTQLLNAASATIRGGEFSFTALAAEKLTLSGQVAVLYGEYGSFLNAPATFASPNCTPAAPLGTPGTYSCNVSGGNMIHAPHFKGNLGVDYVISSGVGAFTLNTTYSYTDAFLWYPDGSLNQPVVSLVNASVLWTHPSGKWDVRLWGNNLNDRKFYSFGSESAFFGKQFSPAAPRTFGITFGAHL